MEQPHNALAYVTLSAHAGQNQLQEDELTRELRLSSAILDQRLLIALGELSGNPRPQQARYATCLPELVLLWLNEFEWLAIPRRSDSLEEALICQFGSQAILELSPDGCIELELSATDQQKVTDAPGLPLEPSNCRPLAPKQISVHPWNQRGAYQLLLNREALEQLQRWLLPPIHH